MKNLLARLLLLAVLVSPELLIAQTREGQVISDALSLGWGKSVPLPEGKWLVKKKDTSLPPVFSGSRASHTGYLLENSNKEDAIQYVLIQESSAPFNWSPIFYEIPPKAKDIQRYSTTNSSLVSKLSYSQLNSDITSEEYSSKAFLSLGIDLKNLPNKFSSDYALASVRIVKTRDAIWYRALIKLPPNKSENLDASLSSISTYNGKLMEAMFFAYNEKKPQEPLFFSFSGQPQGELQAADKKLELEKLLVLEANLKEESQAATKLAEQKRLADEAKAKEELAKQRLAIEMKQREEALALAKLAEKKPLAEETKAQEQLAKEAKQRNEALATARLAEQKRLADEAKAKEQLAKASAPAPQLSKADQLAQLQLQMAALKAELEKGEPPKNQPAVLASARRALVIGNNKYLNVSALENAADDAVAMADTLKTLSFDVTVKTDLSLKDMNAAIRNFKASIKKGDEVVFFYAGHGVQIGQSNFLLPVDITGESEEQIRDDAVLLDRVLDDISEKKAKFTLAMLDACRDNPFKKAGRSVGGGTRGLAPASTANGQMIIFSAGAGQQALDKLGPNDKERNGLFTRVFIKEMQKTGLSVDRVVRNVRNQVVELAKSVKHDQVPAIYDQVIGDFYFKP